MSRAEDRDGSQDVTPESHGPAKVEAVQAGPHEDKEQEEAAQLIQRNYRGYRERRQLEGMGLDASSRWVEVCVYYFPCS
jgi:hypothetical protein